MNKFFKQLFCFHSWYTDEKGNKEYYNEQMAKAREEGANSIAFSFKYECIKCGKKKWVGSGLEGV